MTPAELRIRQIPHGRWLAVDYRLHIADGRYNLAHTPLWVHLFFRTASAVLFSWRGSVACRPAPLVVARGVRLVHGLPLSARLLPLFRSFAPSPCVCPPVRISCDFAPFPCVFLRFPCLALRCLFRRLDFNALFRRFSARFGSARAIYQGNKKSPF